MRRQLSRVKPEEYLNELRKQARAALDPDASTVTEELKALDWQLSELARALTDFERSRGSDPHAIDRARRYLDCAAQRSHRAQLIAQGVRVPKAT